MYDTVVLMVVTFLYSRAKRRSHGGEPSTPGTSPVMDAEASIMVRHFDISLVLKQEQHVIRKVLPDMKSYAKPLQLFLLKLLSYCSIFFFQKILNNLYENTALHEKIAANINRELGGQGKIVLPPHDSHNKPSSDTPALNIISGKRAVELGGGMNRFNEGSGSTVGGGDGGKGVGGTGSRQSSSGGGDPGVLHELDNIVTNIISETTADPEFENLLDEVFGRFLCQDTIFPFGLSVMNRMGLCGICSWHAIPVVTYYSISLTEF